MRKAVGTLILLSVVLVSACTVPPQNIPVPWQCQVDIINGQPVQRPGHEYCVLGADGIIRLRG